MTFLYGITRRDLPPTHQAIQTAHAQLEFVIRNSQVLPELSREHPSFVWLTVADKWELSLVKLMLENQSLATQSFSDPDYDWGDFTALAAIVPDNLRHLLRHLPLWVPERPKLSLTQRLFRFFGSFSA